MSYSKAPKVIDDLTDVDTTSTVPTQGDILVFDGANWVPQQALPTAQITRTSKIANKLTFTAAPSSATMNGDLLTYLWTISPSAGVTIATPAAISTNITCPSGQAEYTLTLTVTSTLTGLSATDTYEFKTDTIIEVMGLDEEHNDLFTKISDVFVWIAANDAANVANYQINVLGIATDTARITPTGAARIHFTDRGRVNVGFDLVTAGTYVYTGIGENFHILAATGTAFTVNAGCTLVCTGMTIGASVGNCITVLASSITIRRCALYAIAAGQNVIQANNSTIQIRQSELYTLSTGSNINATGGTIELHYNYLQGNGSTSNITATLSTMALYSNRLLNTGIVGVTPFNINATNCPGIYHGNNFQVIPNAAVTSKNVYLNCTGGLTGPVTLSNNNFIQSGGNNGTNSCCLMIEGASVQPVSISNNVMNILSTNPAMITVQTASNAAWRLINNFISNQNGGPSLTSSTTNGAIVAVAMVNLNYFNNVFNGAINGPLTFNAGTALTSANHQF